MARASAAESRTQPLASSSCAISAGNGGRRSKLTQTQRRGAPRPPHRDRSGAYISRAPASSPPTTARVRTAHQRRSGSVSARSGRSGGSRAVWPAQVCATWSAASSSPASMASSSAWTGHRARAVDRVVVGAVFPQPGSPQVRRRQVVGQPDQMRRTAVPTVGAAKAWRWRARAVQREQTFHPGTLQPCRAFGDGKGYHVHDRQRGRQMVDVPVERFLSVDRWRPTLALRPPGPCALPT